MRPRRALAALTCAALALAAGPALARSHATVTQPAIATGDPTPIGNVSHQVSPVGYTYQEASPVSGVPGAVVRHAPRKAGAKPAAKSKPATR